MLSMIDHIIHIRRFRSEDRRHLTAESFGHQSLDFGDLKLFALSLIHPTKRVLIEMMAIVLGVILDILERFRVFGLHRSSTESIFAF
jgi:hypothetical protein